MSDALVSPPVFVAAAAVSTALLGVAVWKVGRRRRAAETQDGGNEHLIPLMGVMGAFVFAAQMINFAIPGTGSSGHLVGGILLAAILGPWAALITLSSVLAIQALLFADGGLMALGCNLFNMAVLSCLVAYPLVFRPLFGQGTSSGRTVAASLLASVVGLELGAVAVTLETVASGITALPFGRFLLFMLPIHLLIGIGEGLATAAVIGVVRRYKPELLFGVRRRSAPAARYGRALAAIAALSLAVGASFSWVASSDPDGLEWSIAKSAQQETFEPLHTDAFHRTADRLQQKTAVMPDYDTSLAGIFGSGAILLAAFGAACLFRSRSKQP